MAISLLFRSSLILVKDLVLDDSSALFFFPGNKESHKEKCKEKTGFMLKIQKRNDAPLLFLCFSCKEVKAETNSESKLSRFTLSLPLEKCFCHHIKYD